MGKKGGGSTVQDPRIGELAQTQSDIANQQWDWFQNTYLPQQMQQQQQVQDVSSGVLSQYLNSLMPGQEAAYGQTQQAANQTTQQAIQQMATQGATGDQIFQTWNQDYAPLYSQIAQTAAAKGGQADQDYQSMLARGDVSQAFANQNAQTQRYLAQYGQSPTSGAATAGVRSNAISEAAQEAAAQTAARQAAANLGWTYQTQAAQLGQGLLSAGNEAYAGSQSSGLNAINAQTGVLNAGNALGNTYAGAVNTAGAPISSMNQIASGMTGGQSAVNQGLSGATSALNTQLATQAQQQAASQKSSGSLFGSILGAVGTIGGGIMGGPIGAAAGKAITGAISGS